MPTATGKKIPASELQRRKEQSQRDKAAHAARQTGRSTPRKKPTRSRANTRNKLWTEPHHIAAVSSMKRTAGSSNAGMALCRQMAMPYTKPVIRMPTNDMARTAVATFRYTHEISGSNFATNTNYGTDDAYFMLVGQPALLGILGPINVGTATTLAHHAWAVTQSAQARAWSPGCTFVGSRELNAWFPFGRIYVSSAGLSIPGDDWYPVARSDGIPYMFMGYGAKVTINHNTSVNNTLTVSLWQFVGPSQRPHRVATKEFKPAVVGGLTPEAIGPVPFAVEEAFSVPRTGHYAVMYESATNTSNVAIPTIEIDVDYNPVTAPGAHYWSMVGTPDLNPSAGGDAGMGQSVRRTGMSMCLTNTSAALIAQGLVEGARVVLDDFCEFSSTTVSKASERYVGPATKGIYTYMDFTAEAERFHDVVEGDGYASLTYDLNSSDLFHLIHLSGNTMDSSYVLTYDVTIEFRTDKQRYDTATPTLSYLELLEARRINNSTSYFYENPLHPRDIMRFIASAWNAVRGNANRIAAGVSAMYPEFAPIALPLGHILQR